MPVLPDKTSISAGSARAERPIARLQNPGSVGTSGVGEGIAEFSTAVGKFAEQVKKERDSSDAIRSDGELTVGLSQLERTISENPNFAEHGKKFDDSVQSLRDKTAAKIRSRSLRNRWMLGAEARIESSRDRVLSRSLSLSRNAARVDAENAFEAHVERFTDPEANDQQRAQALADIRAGITVGQRSGLFTPAQADALGDRYINGAVRADAIIRLATDPAGLMADIDSDRYSPLSNLQRTEFKVRASSAAEKQRQEAAQRARARDIVAGIIPVDPGSKADRELIDAAFEQSGISGQLTELSEVGAQRLGELVKDTGYVPVDALSQLRAMATNGTTEAKVYAYQSVALVLREKPGAFAGTKHFADIRADAEHFNALVLDGGLPPLEAVRRIEETKTPEFKARAEVLGTEARKIASKIQLDDVSDQITGKFVSRREAELRGITQSEGFEFGGSPRRGAVILGVYRRFFRDHFVRTGDAEISKNLAVRDVRRTYDVSSINGTRRLMKHPPESHYPKVDGGHEYFSKQLVEDVNKLVLRGDLIPLNDIFIEAVPQTDEDIRKGRPPSYGVVWFQLVNGIRTLQTASGLVFRADVKAARKASVEARRDELKRERELQIELQKTSFRDVHL